MEGCIKQEKLLNPFKICLEITIPHVEGCIQISRTCLQAPSRSMSRNYYPSRGGMYQLTQIAISGALMSRNYYPSRGGMYPQKKNCTSFRNECLEITIPHVEGCMNAKKLTVPDIRLEITIPHVEGCIFIFSGVVMLSTIVSKLLSLTWRDVSNLFEGEKM